MTKEEKNADVLTQCIQALTFNDATASLIDKGVSFVPIPRSVNKTELIAACRRFERKCRWKEYFYDDHEESDVNDTGYFVPPWYKIEANWITSHLATLRNL